MPGVLRSYFEPRFGTDLGYVRLHTDGAAASLASELRANAFTTGNDIFFATGRYQPHTDEGRRLLAHEVVHTIQQGHGGARQLQRQEHSSAALEEAKAELVMDETSGHFDPTPEEAQAAKKEAPALDPGKVTAEAKAAEAADKDTPEVEIPDFQVDTSECVTLWDEGAEPDTPQQQEAGGDDSLFDYLMGVATSQGIGGFFSIPTKIPALAGAYLWKKLPLSVRASVINHVIDAGLAVTGKVSSALILGPLGSLFQAGIMGFLKRLRKTDDKEKVSLFEKLGGILLGLNLKANAGFAVGFVMGFLKDGLVGTVQAILDMVCFVPRALNFITTFAYFFKSLPDQMQAAWDAIKEAAASITSGVSSAVSELKELVRDPARAIAVLTAVHQAAKSKASEIGESIADAFLNMARLPAEQLGKNVGRLVGQIVFEVVASYVTAGAEAGIASVKVAAHEAVKWILELGKKFFAFVKLIIPRIQKVADLAVNAGKFLNKAFKAVCGKIDQVIQRIVDFFYSMLGLCRKGSMKCKAPPKKKLPKDKVTGCGGRFAPPAGGYPPHDIYTKKVTGRGRDFVIYLNKALNCKFDAKKGPLLIECKTGYRWLAAPDVRKRLWPFAWLRLKSQAVRCLATAMRCGYLPNQYVWYVQSKDLATVLNDEFGGYPQVYHKP
jgi:hypothetical protein